MHKYHLVLATGDERDVTASAIRLEAGILSFLNGAGETTLCYAPGSWTYVELERKDDRG
jgi:hypothetical protein